MKRSFSLAMALCGLLLAAPHAQADDNQSQNQQRKQRSSFKQQFSDHRDGSGSQKFSEFAKSFKKKHHQQDNDHHDQPSGSPVHPLPPIVVDPTPVSQPIVRDHRNPRRPGRRPPLDVSQAPGGVVVTSTSRRPKVTPYNPSKIIVRDHRDPIVVTSGQSGPIIRDHRTPVGPIVRDHRTPKLPVVRDHREEKTYGGFPISTNKKVVTTETVKPTSVGPVVRDHRDQSGPVIRDHRKPKGPIVRDHR